jgi:hypothetical protein
MVGFALAIACVGIVTAVTGRIGDGNYAVSGDAHYIYLTARSLAFDGDLDLTNQLRAFGDRWAYGRDPASDGWRFPPREIGPSLTMLPGLWLHHVVSAPARLAPTFAVVVPAMSLAVLFLVLARILDRLELGARSPDELALVGTLGFVVPFYAVGRVGYAHAPDAAVCALLLYALVRGASAWRVGALLALAVLFRLQNFLWLAWPVVESWRARGRGDAGTWTRPATIGAVGLLGLAPQAWLAAMHPGTRLGPIRWGADFFDLDAYPADLFAVLMGGHGLLTWTPLAAIAIAGLLWAARTRDWPGAVPALTVLGAMVLLMASVRDPSGGWAFGARRLSGCAGILCVGVGLAGRTPLARARPHGWRALTWGLIAINLLLVGLALSGRISLAP